eukprot:369818_1
MIEILQLYKEQLKTTRDNTLLQLDLDYTNRINILLRQKTLICKQIHHQYDELFANIDHIINKQFTQFFDTLNQCKSSSFVPNPPNFITPFVIQNDTKQSTFHCTHCNKSFESNQQLIKHSAIHNTQRPFPCVHCHKQFATQSQLNKHKITHNRRLKLEQRNNEINSDSDSDYDPSTENKPWPKNEIKHRIITHKNNGKQRQRRKKGSGKFKCDICFKSYATKGSLATHYRLHTGDAKFKCPYCGDAFYQQIQLTHHTIKQHQQMPFQCDICKKSAFKQQGKLKAHKVECKARLRLRYES